MILTRKIQLIPCTEGMTTDETKVEVNRIYHLLRDGIYAQNKAYNIFISRMYTATILGASKEELKEIRLKGERTPKESDSDYSLYDFDKIKFIKGLPQASALGEQALKALKKQQKDGLYKGKVSLACRKLDAPMWIKTKFSFFHKYNDYQEFLDHLYCDDLKIYMKFVQGIVFETVLGNPHKSETIRAEFQQIFEGHYKLCSSSLQIKDKKIMLNLAIDIPEKEIELNDETVVGVDIGIAIPAVCALNSREYIHKSIGSAEELLRIRTQLQSQKRRLQKNLKNTTGGHGRSHKLAPLDKLAKRERNFVQTYNHMISKTVVEFAVKNKAKYINLEDLSNYKDNGSEFILRNWSYFELQSQIEYKAKMHGIIVRKINPYHTSQICSKCGHWEEGQRISQSKFKCKSCGYESNADFNAARNIALSTDFIE
ncbi:MAG: RNA-guided endonuclease TnpB family protein [Lachnospiraceae bacterium]